MLTVCMIDDSDTWTMYRSGERKAAKAHTCNECGRTIAKDERYHYATGLMYDRWDVFKMCAQCHAASIWLLDVCGGWLHHAVLEDLEEHWGEDYLYRSLSFGRVILASRTRWTRNDRLIPADQVRAWVSDALARVPARAYS